MSGHNNALITLGSNGSVTCQRFGHDDIFTRVRDNDPELTQLFAEGRFDIDMFASDDHPLLDVRDHDYESEQWPSSGRRRGRRTRKRAR